MGYKLDIQEISKKSLRLNTCSLKGNAESTANVKTTECLCSYLCSLDGYEKVL